MADADALGPIVRALESSTVYLGPGTKSWLTPAQIREIEAAVSKGHLPVKVVLAQPADTSSIKSGDDLLVRLHDAGAPDGLYVGIDNVWHLRSGDKLYQPYLGSGTNIDQLNLALQQWGDVAGEDDLTDTVDRYLSYGDDGNPLPFGDGLVQVVQHLAKGEVDTLARVGEDGLTASLAKHRSTTSTGSTGSAGSPNGNGGAATPWIIGGGVVLLLAAGAVGLRRLGRRSSRRPGGAFVLPDSVLDRVREAEAAETRRRARADVVALGERIDATDLDAHASELAATSWQTALDHYDAAARLMPSDATAEVDLLDAVGAIVLAQRGDGALTAALASKAYVPTTPCFLNPLHGNGDRTQLVEHGGVRVKAPLCRRCRADLKAHRRPDILTVVVRGKPEHYFETGREPWASTGFGALEPDLVGRLQGRRG